MIDSRNTDVKKATSMGCQGGILLVKSGLIQTDCVRWNRSGAGGRVTCQEEQREGRRGVGRVRLGCFYGGNLRGGTIG